MKPKSLNLFFSFCSDVFQIKMKLTQKCSIATLKQGMSCIDMRRVNQYDYTIV